MNRFLHVQLAHTDKLGVQAILKFDQLQIDFQVILYIPYYHSHDQWWIYYETNKA